MSSPIVLIVDDDASIRRLIRIVLLREHFNVEEAASGNEAIARIRIKKYDAVVLDLMMGPGSGFEVLDALDDRRPGDKCAIVVTATTPAVINKLDSESIFAKIRKPFDINELVGEVRRCCEH